MIGKTISHYKILEKIGQGGMGEVFLAEDKKLKRKVAIKFLTSQLTNDKQSRERFEREAQAAAALSHPNIVTIYEINQHDGQTFIAMEHADGHTLREEISKGPMEADRVVEISRQLCAGLGEAHKAGIVHRDIKPENILIDKSGRVKILDFGLARIRGVTKLTKDASTLGTLKYMSPEQYQNADIDRRTDIWSLGVVLYEMITGQLPFQGDYEAAVMYSVVNEEPVQITKLQSNIAFELEKIVNRCLEKDLSARYQNVSDLLLDLQNYQQNLLASTTGSKQQKTSRVSGRLIPPWFWIAGFVIIVTLAMITMFKFFAPSEERRDSKRKILRALPSENLSPSDTMTTMFKLFAPSEERRDSKRKMLVVLPFENLGPSEDEYFADGITEEITSRLAALKGLGVISRTSARHYKSTDITISQIGKELNVDYILEGSVRWQRSVEDESRVRITPRLIRVSDDTHLWSEHYDRLFQDIFNIQSEIAEQIIQRLDITLSESENRSMQVRPTDNVVAYQSYLRGLDYLKYSHAPEDQYRKAQMMFEQAIELDPDFALAYVKLSKAHRSLYFFGYDHTSERIEKSREAVDRALELQPKLPAAHMELGYYYYHGYLDYDKALKEFSIAAKSLPNDNELLANIAYVWRRQGLFEQAINNLEHALALSPNNASLMTELAHSYLCIRKYEDVVRYCNQDIRIAPENKWAYLIKALCYWCWKGDIVNARSALEDMPDKRSPYSIYFLFLQDIYEKNYQGALDRLSTLSIETIEVQSVFMPKYLLKGWAYSFLNDSLRAKSSFEAARILLEQVLLEQPDDPRVHSALGLTYASLGRKKEAIREGKKAVELYPVTKDAILGTNRIADLISIYVMTGNYNDAMDQITYLLSIPSYHSIHYFCLTPRMDPLRNYPRFQRLMEGYSK